MQGSESGGRQTKLDMRAVVTVGISILIALLGVASFVIARLKP